MTTCDRCNSLAFVRSAPDLVLCKKCFSNRIEKRVKKTIHQYKMLHFGSRVAVGLSGGKDSIVLLTILKKIILPDINLNSIIINEGIEGYRSKGVEIAKKFSKKLDIEYSIISFKDHYELSLDEMIVKAPFGKSSCAICGTFRRKALNIGALKLNADYLATGHNLDDEVESIQLNLLRGDIHRFKRLTRQPQRFHTKLIPRIKPLVLISQPEIVFYAIANNLNYHDEICPYAHSAMRNSVRNFLSNQEKYHFGTFKNIIKFHEILSLELKNNDFDEINTFNECRNCGDLTDNKEFCMGCRILFEINK